MTNMKSSADSVQPHFTYADYQESADYLRERLAGFGGNSTPL